jgi:hypothetical protein
MKTTYKNTILIFFATFMCLMLLVPFAHAVTRTPLDCPGVIAVRGGYLLIQDTTCTNGFQWFENDKFFSLNGFTLTSGSILVGGNRLTIRNGALQTTGITWGFATNDGTLSNLSLSSHGIPRGFFIDAGSNFTVKNSLFTNIPNIALSFYYGDGGSVKNSMFIGNGTAISIQKSNGVMINHNRFVGNIRAVNLWDEDNGGVNNNKICYNIFQKNQVGINLLAKPPYLTSILGMNGNQIVGNRISHSGHSGILMKVSCGVPINSNLTVCPAQHTIVVDNYLNHNGFDSLTNLPVGDEPDDDGVTARASLIGTPNGSSISYPDGLAGVMLSNNRADRNADLGFDVGGIADGGGQTAEFNGNPIECVGLLCDIGVGEPQTVWGDARTYNPLVVLQQGAISGAPLAIDQLSHKQ